MQAIVPTTLQDANEVDEIIAHFGGDPRQALSMVLADCRHLQEQLWLSSQAVSLGFTRGWHPQQRNASHLAVGASASPVIGRSDGKTCHGSD